MYKKYVALFLAAFVISFAWIAMSAGPVVAENCSGVMGDFNNDGDFSCVEDIFVYFYHYMYLQGDPPPCPNQVDHDCDEDLEFDDFIWYANYCVNHTPEPTWPCSW